MLCKHTKSGLRCHVLQALLPYHSMHAGDLRRPCDTLRAWIVPAVTAFYHNSPNGPLNSWPTPIMAASLPVCARRMLTYLSLPLAVDPVLRHGLHYSITNAHKMHLGRGVGHACLCYLPPATFCM